MGVEKLRELRELVSLGVPSELRGLRELRGLMRLKG